ncbi:AMP-binding protein [Dongshaea marina]|uniref:AMP-binding protein n=1 Tax=Dongshaea marina TaxID=2047966 RepID=UPI000D3EA36A|nr:AMP-binding protein [Dongshaea marina]
MPLDVRRPSELDPKQSAQRLLNTVQKLMLDLRQGQVHLPPPQLDSDFDRDLGLDSLARSELLQRVEQEFGITLSEQILADMETPRDLLRQLLCAGGQDSAQGSEQEIQQIQLPHTDASPSHAQTLQQVLDWHLESHPLRPHLYVYESAGQLLEVSHQSLKQQAEQIAAGLIELGLEPGQSVAIMLPTSCDYFYSFFAVLLARGIPVPIYPPARLSQIEDHMLRHAKILQNSQVRILITVQKAKGLCRLLKLQLPLLKKIMTASELRLTGHPVSAGPAQSSEIALLQYTSGSTGNPKGVMLTHANLLANVRGIGRSVQASSADITVSWLPVYHDMGLIGAWLGSLYHGIPLVIMSPLQFLSKPQSWLWAIHRHRGTLSPAPNFAYELCLNKINDADLQGLDLSCWRQAWNGAEPVAANTIRRFSERFAQYGFRPEAMAPSYGLAECSVGLTFPPLGRLPRIERIQREPLERTGKALPAAGDDKDVIQMVGLGQPLPGHQIRIIDSFGRELPEREEGVLEFQGPSATCGYYQDPEKTRQLLHDQWLATGDRGYLAGGELFLTGRVKDIIIRAGRNIYPHELEEAIATVPGIRKGCIAVFAASDRRSATEKLIVLAETREQLESQKQQLKLRIIKLAVDLLGTAPDEILLAPPHTIPKTSSGKIRRAASRELYQRGELATRQRAVWWQLLRLSLAGIKSWLKNIRRTASDLLYAAYVWLVTAIIAPLVWCLTALLPNRRICRSIARGGARLLMALTGTSLTIKGRENLPQKTPCILVSNHTSYLDGLLMICAVPIDYCFVAKAELKQNLFARIFLSRLGCEFVERFDTRKGLADARRITADAKNSRSFFFFPEGTLYRMPGLHKFHLGAFIAAVDAKLPVIPITIHGARSKLRDISWFPRRGGLEVTIDTPLEPQGTDWSAALKLRDRARAVILSRCKEPDLTESMQ